MRSKIKRIIKSKGYLFIPLLIIFLFPFGLGWLYSHIINANFPIKANESLTYFATAFGIVGSFVTYRHEAEKKEKSKYHELQPDLWVNVKESSDDDQIFTVSIYNHSKYIIKDFYVFDEYFSRKLTDSQEFKICFNKSKKDYRELKLKEQELINICTDQDIMDTDKFPKYILVNCDDNENNMWNCIFEKKVFNDDKHYIPYYELT